MSSEDPQRIKPRSAKSGKIDYGDPVILKENSQTRVTFIPYFIPRSTGAELASKIVTWKKAKSGPSLVEHKSISLSADENRQLLKALKSHLAVAGEGTFDSEYVAVPIGGGVTADNMGGHDPKTVAQALVSVLGQGEIARHLADTELTSELSHAFRGAIRIREIQSAIEKLRAMLEGGVVGEKYYQNWCDEHYWALGPARQITDNYRSISISDQVDKLLPEIASGLSDVVELKRPNMPVLQYDSDHRNYYFSAEASKAIGQCHRYLDILHDEAAKGLRDHPEIVAYHPRAIVIIGRSNDWHEDKTRALHGLNQRLRSIKIMTFDHLLAQSEAILRVLSPDDPIENEVEFNSFSQDFDDEIPF